MTRLAAEVPRQEAGRCRPSELVLSRANKSVRVFEHIVARLSQGRQPDAALIASVGYIMRTTAVYGNGKFGIADRARVAARPELSGPFSAEMLSVYLIRCFTLDLVEAVARATARRAGAEERYRPLAPRFRRFLGIGNSTGLGMAPFLVKHPTLINNWIAARETGLARVRAVEQVQEGVVEGFGRLVQRAKGHIAQWKVDDERQMRRIERLRQDLEQLSSWLEEGALLAKPHPWDRLFRRAQGVFSLEGQELLVSLLLEPHGALVDDLVQGMSAEPDPGLDSSMPLARLRSLIEEHYRWALAVDFQQPGALERFWYVSEKKQEPRLGQRDSEPGADRESPLDVARQIQALSSALSSALEEAQASLSPGSTVAEFLLRWPEHRHALRRVQWSASHPYGEIQENLLDRGCLPIDLLRCKLSFFGASKFDPKSDRWTRITLFQGAPLPEDLNKPGATDWCFPVLEPGEEEQGGIGHGSG